MITRRRLSVAAITASCAALAVLGAASGAMASSNVTTTGQIKACYKTGGSLPPLDHIAATGTCPTGDSALTWNKTGPRGPAGLSTGISGIDQATVNLQANNFIQVMATAAAPATGTYYVSTSEDFVIAPGDIVACALQDNQGDFGGQYDVGPFPNAVYDNIPIDAAVSVTAGDTVRLICADDNSTSQTFGGSMTGTLINSATGSAAKPSPATRHPLLPPR